MSGPSICRCASKVSERARRALGWFGWFAVAALVWVASATAAQACRTVQLLSPAPRVTLADPRPEFVWRERPDATGYWLRIESAVPEGRPIAQLLVRTQATRYRPDVVLAESRAAVWVRVWSDCEGDPPSLLDAPAHFFIDRGLACGAIERLRLEPRRHELRWRPVRGAERYQVLSIDADGTLGRPTETRRAAATLAPDGRVRIVTVRAWCGPNPGPLGYLVLDAK